MVPVLTINNRVVHLTNLERLLWPDSGYTKRDLIRYYIEVSPFLLPYLENRPLVVRRFPGGIGRESFYQKNIPAGAPDWIKAHPIAHGEREIAHYIVANDVETLTWLGNQACLELHPWLSSSDTLEQPDFAVFDLDPMEKSTFQQVCRVALLIRELLDCLGLKCYPKTSGATGIQVYLPLIAIYSYREVRRFVEAICRQVNEQLPDITTMERLIKKRGGKIYLDYLQNGRGKTIVAPYSPRPLPGAPVSMPLSWEEVAGGKIRPEQFSISTALDYLKKNSNRYQAIITDKQKLPEIAIKCN